MSGSGQFEAVEVGVAGTYDGAVTMTRDGSSNMVLKDAAIPAGISLTDLRDTVATHSIAGHDDLATDFAGQYYNEARLAAYLADSGAPPAVATGADVGGNTTLGAHVADATIHQQVPKFVLRVALEGQAYSTIAAALNAIPTSGADAPGPDQWWMIEVAPGVYAESITVARSYVIIRGAGQEATKLKVGAVPMVSVTSASYVVLERLTFESTNAATGENVALLLGSETGIPAATDITVRDCVIKSPGSYALKVNAVTSRVRVERCRVTAGYGAAVLVRGPVELEGCTLERGASEDRWVQVEDVAAVSGVAQVALRRCRGADSVTSGYVLAVKSSAVRVEELLCWDTLNLATTVTGNGASTVEWARMSATAKANVAEGTVTLTQIRDAGLSTRGDVLVNWRETGRTLRSGIGADGVAIGLVGAWSGTDHQFVRYLSGGTPSGDVVEVWDRSTAGTTNGVKLKLSASTGKFARWVAEAAGVETELGYIGKDGKVYAPGLSTGGADLTPAGTTSEKFLANSAGTAAGRPGLSANDGDAIHHLVWDEATSRWRVLQEDEGGLEALEASTLYGAVSATQLTGTVDADRLPTTVARLINAIASESTAISNVTGWQVYDRSVTIPTSALAVGGLYRIIAGGTFDCASAATWGVAVKVGGTDAAFHQIAASAGWAGIGWASEALVRVTATGAAGAWSALNMGTAIRTNAINVEVRTGSAIDMSAGLVVTVQGNWTVAAAGNTSKLIFLMVQRIG